MTTRCGECGGALADHRCVDCGTQHGAERRVSYPAMTRELALLLCVETTEHGPCRNCEDAAIRVITKRRSVRQFLNRFREAPTIPLARWDHEAKAWVANS